MNEYLTQIKNHVIINKKEKNMFDNLKTKIRYLIKKILLNFQYKNKYSITYKGSYLIQYILDVYINKTKKRLY